MFWCEECIKVCRYMYGRQTHVIQRLGRRIQNHTYTQTSWGTYAENDSVKIVLEIIGLNSWPTNLCDKMSRKEYSNPYLTHTHACCLSCLSCVGAVISWWVWCDGRPPWRVWAREYYVSQRRIFLIKSFQLFVALPSSERVVPGEWLSYACVGERE